MTIRELAKLAGVSRTTVSRALNNAADVSPETRERIIALAKKLNYRANPMVTTLMADVRRRRVGKNRAIIAIVPPPIQKEKWGMGFGHFSHQLYRKGVEKRSNELGFKVEDFMVGNFRGSYKRLSQVLYQRGIQGLLVPSIDVKDHPTDYDYSIDWDRFSAVGIGFSVAHPQNLDRTVMSQFGSALNALRRIKELGYRKIGFGGRLWNIERTQGRWLGAYLYFQTANEDIDTLPYFSFEWDGSEKERLLDWLGRYKPDAILGDGHFYKLLRECGVSVPGDVGYAAIDLLPGLAEYQGIAGNDQRFESVGAAVVEMIADKLNRNERGLPDEPHVLKIAGRWSDGPSLPPISTPGATV